MDSSAIIEIDGVGPVLFERSKRAKHLNISVKPFTGIRVAVPDSLSFKKATEFVHAKTSWIHRNMERMKQYEKETKILSGTLTDIDRVKAKRKLTRRLRYLAEKHGFTYNKSSIRNQKTRWGSCSSRNNISLNMKLVTLPEELMDFVILHELTHIRHKNHGNEFWAELDRIAGNGKDMASRLREHGIRLLREIIPPPSSSN